MRQYILLAAASLIVATPAVFAAGEIYRWKDASGIWHYSDQPQPGAELISGARPPTPPPTAPTPAPAPRAATSATGSDLPAVTSQVAQQVRNEAAAAKNEQCKKAEESYTRTVQARRMYKTDEQGNRIFLNDAELDAARLQARSARDLACGQ